MMCPETLPEDNRPEGNIPSPLLGEVPPPVGTVHCVHRICSHRRLSCTSDSLAELEGEIQLSFGLTGWPFHIVRNILSRHVVASMVQEPLDRHVNFPDVHVGVEVAETPELENEHEMVRLSRIHRPYAPAFSGGSEDRQRRWPPHTHPSWRFV